MIYMDYNATTPVHPDAAAGMQAVLREIFGNPSSGHEFGTAAHAAVDQGRTRTAELIGAAASEVTFTAGGTEADNLAVKGTVHASGADHPHIITSTIEHPAIIKSCQWLKRFGCRVTYIPVDGQGLVDPDDIRQAITDTTVLISIMLANNETGAVQPVAEIAALAHEHEILCHTDAVQAVGKIPVDVDALGVDLLSLAGHKIHGPKGIGALYLREGTTITPLIHGGGHENGLRGGTENVPGMAGLGIAAERAGQALSGEITRLRELRDRLEQGIQSGIADTQVNGHLEKRLPNTCNISFKNGVGETITGLMNDAGFAVSSGAACHAGQVKVSAVLEAMGIDTPTALGAVRFSLGRDSTAAHIDAVLQALPAIIKEARRQNV